MSKQSSQPIEPKKFILTAFIAFVVVFVFAMLMMLLSGDYSHDESGRHYNTKVVEP